LVNSIAAFTTARDATLPKCPAGQGGKTREKMRAAPGRLQRRAAEAGACPRTRVKVDRSTLFGNPFLAVDYGSNGAVALFRAWITGRCANVCLAPEAKRALARRRTDILGALPALRGKNLACWCPLPSRGEPDTCHAANLRGGGVGCGSVLEGRQKLPAQAGSGAAEVGADLISQGSES
jgi:hypothetical protein